MFEFKAFTRFLMCNHRPLREATEEVRRSFRTLIYTRLPFVGTTRIS